MRISVDNRLLFELTDIQKKVILNEINEDIFEDDIKRRLQYIVMHKYEQCLDRLKREWEPKLRSNGVGSIPLDPDTYAVLVFSQPNYKSRKQRDVEEASRQPHGPKTAMEPVA